MPVAPKVIRRPEFPQTEQAQDEHHREEQEPDFVNRVAAVENKSGRNGHRERGQTTNIASDERLEFQRQTNANDADENNRQAQRPDISSEQESAEKRT